MRSSFVLGLVAFLLALGAIGIPNAGRLETMGAWAFYGPLLRTSGFIGLAVWGCTYGFRYGGTPERVAAVVISSTIIADPLLHIILPVRFAQLDPTHFTIDFIRFAAFLMLAMRTDRIWTIWFAALQLLALLSHPARELGLDVNSVAYAIGSAIWTYGLLPILIVGTRHHVQLLARGERPKYSSGY